MRNSKQLKGLNPATAGSATDYATRYREDFEKNDCSAMADSLVDHAKLFNVYEGTLFCPSAVTKPCFVIEYAADDAQRNIHT